MNKTKRIILSLFIGGFCLAIPLGFASADISAGNRFFVKSNKGFWKNALGVRHEFQNGFTAELSDFQVRLAKIFGVDVEPVDIFQISPEDQKTDLSGRSKKPNSPTPKRYTPSDQTPWGIETIYNDSFVAATNGGGHATVAILDTGIFSSHPDLSSRISQCRDFTNNRMPVIDGKCEDKNGHGTHVAGIVAADGGVDKRGIYGVAPETSLLVYKVCGPRGSCYADDIAFALRMAADVGANVVNMSFGSNKDVQLIKDAAQYADSKGSLLVAAAGNDGPFPESIDYPAAYPFVMGVGAIDQTRAVTYWSSRGINSQTTPYLIEERDIEFAAPGEYIESTWDNGGYAVLSGTSMASPFITGLAAKLWQYSSNNPAQETRSLIRLLADDLLPLGDDDASGFGLPQVSY